MDIVSHNNVDHDDYCFLKGRHTMSHWLGFKKDVDNPAYNNNIAWSLYKISSIEARIIFLVYFATVD